jgi:hypothetical protein
MMNFDAQDQYRAMMRAYGCLERHAEDMGTAAAISYDASDLAKRFFLECYHLKDWLKKSDKIPSTEIERCVSGSQHLSLAADISNSLKHAGLSKPPRSGLPFVAFNTELTVRIPASAAPGQSLGDLKFSRNPRDGDTLKLVRGDFARFGAGAVAIVTFGERRWNCLELARDCVREWNGLLAHWGIEFTTEE